MRAKSVVPDLRCDRARSTTRRARSRSPLSLERPPQRGCPTLMPTVREAADADEGQAECRSAGGSRSASAPTSAPAPCGGAGRRAKRSSIPGTSASPVGDAEGSPVSVDSPQARALFAAIAPATALTVVPLSRNTESPSCKSRTQAFAIASLAAGLAAWRPASSRSTVGCSATAPPRVRFSSPAGLEHPEVLADRRLGDAEPPWRARRCARAPERTPVRRSSPAASRQRTRGSRRRCSRPFAATLSVTIVTFRRVCFRFVRIEKCGQSTADSVGTPAPAIAARVPAPTRPAALPRPAACSGATWRTAWMLEAEA